MIQMQKSLQSLHSCADLSGSTFWQYILEWYIAPPLIQALSGIAAKKYFSFYCGSFIFHYLKNNADRCHHFPISLVNSLSSFMNLRAVINYGKKKMYLAVLEKSPARTSSCVLQSASLMRVSIFALLLRLIPKLFSRQITMQQSACFIWAN